MRLYCQTFYLYRIVSYRKTEIWKTVDWLTIILYVVLVVAGWFSICGASYEFDNVGLFDPSGRPGSQLMWMGLSVGLIFVLLMLESEFFDVFAYLICRFHRVADCYDFSGSEHKRFPFVACFGTCQVAAG